MYRFLLLQHLYNTQLELIMMKSVRYSRQVVRTPLRAISQLALPSLFGILLCGSANAQLLHRYDFETAGSANDTIGTANGTIYGSAVVAGGFLNTPGTAGGLNAGVPQNCVGLPVSAVAGITNAFTIQIWYL